MGAKLASILKAAGEPTRLRILNLLRQESICVCDLQTVLRTTQPKVSRHLAALRHAGLVTDERTGTKVVYSLTPEASPQVRALYEILEKCCSQEETLREDLSRLQKMGHEDTSTTSKEKPDEEQVSP